ncbi:hypothetical protein [uncultured Helicobacter sp.]|mgnify:CR=1 FL=1|uniref:hypothetical protein n=2 Tax=uncultured Helicobacter sp. TaxID=175537 RepID=UPI001C39F4F6|nr:hypothetical protein [Candidatus Helicobacter avicola]
MQTLSNMRRDSSHSQSLKNILFLLGLFVYECLASVIVYLPPLLGILFVLFVRYDTKGDFWRFCIIVAIIFVVEIFYDMPLWFLFVLFVVLYYVVTLWLANFNAKYILNIAQVVFVYMGVYLAFIYTEIITGTPLLINPLVIVYYCVFEAVMVSIYEYAV